MEELQCSKREGCSAAEEEEEAGLLQGKLAAGCAIDSRWEWRSSGRELARTVSHELKREENGWLSEGRRSSGRWLQVVRRWPAECRKGDWPG